MNREKEERKCVYFIGCLVEEKEKRKSDLG